MNIAKSSSLLLRTLAGSALLAVLAATSGCFLVAVGAAGAAGAGTVAYVDGRLDATLSSRYADVGMATNRAIDQLQLIKVSESKDAFTDNFVIRMANDKKVAIVLTKAGDQLTKVEIRVGIFGDRPMSMAILEKIKADV